MHVDFGSSDASATHARVLELDGWEVERHEIGDFHWTVFADPEGNEFCVAQADPDDARLVEAAGEGDRRRTCFPTTTCTSAISV